MPLRDVIRPHCGEHDACWRTGQWASLGEFNRAHHDPLMTRAENAFNQPKRPRATKRELWLICVELGKLWQTAALVYLLVRAWR